MARTRNTWRVIVAKGPKKPPVRKTKRGSSSRRRGEKPEPVDHTKITSSPLPALGNSRRRRSSTRLKVSKRVDYTYDGREVFAYTRDIGGRGLFLRTTRALEVGTSLDLLIHLESDHQLALRGKVARVTTEGSDNGMAISVQDGSAGQAELASFVLEKLQDKALARLEVSPANTSVLCQLAEILVESGKYDEAVETLQRGVLAKAANPELRNFWRSCWPTRHRKVQTRRSIAMPWGTSMWRCKKVTTKSLWSSAEPAKTTWTPSCARRRTCG